MTTVISIGFNRQGTTETLSGTERALFAADVIDLVEATGGAVVFVGSGQGFDPTTGDTEPSLTVIAVGDLDQWDLRYGLSALAEKYDQQSIAVTEGLTSFIPASWETMRSTQQAPFEVVGATQLRP